MRTTAIILPSILLASLAAAQIERNPEITKEEILFHIKYLASDSLEGRASGSHGARMAAAYIAHEFESYGLYPASGGSFRQPFEFVARTELGPGNRLWSTAGRIRSTWKLETDFRPLPFSGSGEYSGSVVFVGYGITAKDLAYDDYRGVDVRGKSVLLLRNSPAGDSVHSRFGEFAGLRYKVAKAQEMGAHAVFVATGPLDADEDRLIKMPYDPSAGSVTIPVFNVSRAVADAWLKTAGKTVRECQTQINRTRTPFSFALEEESVQLNADVVQKKSTTENIVAYVPGRDSASPDEEFIVVGAHYDHLGYGGEGSGSLQPDTVAIHHGADDNASGVAGVLELAQYFKSRHAALKRSLLFISFSGEELGLLGSAFYVNHPLKPLDRTVTMVNMDMIGRLQERKLIVYGVGTSPGFTLIANEADSDSSLDLKLNKDGFGPSDQSSFYAKQVPVFFFFTDVHSDYHRPSDTYEKINGDGEVTVLRYVARVIWELDTTSERPSYVQVERPREAGLTEREGLRTYTGTIPDFGGQAEGMKISGVRPGSPAEKGGLKGGDVIIKFGKVDIKNIYDYTFALGEYKPGDEVDVVVMRGTDRMVFRVKLERRN